MRRCVFLTVLLSLVLSLGKGNTATTTTAPPTTATPTTTGKITETTTAPSTTATPTTTGKITETTTAPSTTATPTTTGNTATTTTAPPTTATPATTGKITETTTAPSTTATPTTTGKITETTTAPSTTATPTTTGKITETTTAPSMTATPTTTGDLCNPDPCGEKLAKCIALNSTFTCQCQYGFYYSNKDCHRGQIYPGVIILKGFYSNSVQSVNSVEYEEVFQKITTFFKDAFQGIAGFGQTVIVEIQPLRESRASLSMSVTVTNLFMENSAVDNKTVSSAINNAIKKSPYVSQYRATSYCAVFNCDAQTTYCEENVFPKCICKSNFLKTEWDDRSCSDCSKDCSAEENKYCAKENGAPTCKCMPNFENKNGKCVACPVGYSGENCKNNSELILIIVGTVFGAIILSLVIAVSIVSVRAKHKQDPEKKSLMKSRYSSPNTSDDGQATMFPRVQTSSGHANPGYQPNNPYEMCSANRGRFPERDYVDLYEISREPEGFRTQKRY